MITHGVLEHRISVQRQLVLYKSVSCLTGHLAIRNLVTGEILGGKLGAVDRGGEVVIVYCFEVDLPDLLGEVVFLLGRETGNVAQMHLYLLEHDGPEAAQGEE